MISKAWHLPLRLAAGAFILNSGMSKRGIEGEAAEGLHAFAVSGIPEVEKVEPDTLASALSASEIGLGVALLTPLVPSWLAGAWLTAFGLGLNRLYWNAPGMRQPNDVRPTQDGIPLAKDVWLTGMGAALVIDALINRRGRG